MVVRQRRSLSRSICDWHLPQQEHTYMSEHVRDHRSLLATAEKRLLIAIAQRLPLWVHSDHLTGLAMAAMAVASAGYVLARWDTRALWLVVFALAVNWFGDSLDGTLARVRKVERPKYGFYVDHVLDIVGITLLFGGLAASPFMSPVIALALLVAYLLVSGEVFLATAVRGVFKMSFGGIGPTELRILLAIGTDRIAQRSARQFWPSRSNAAVRLRRTRRDRLPGVHTPDFGDAERRRAGTTGAARVSRLRRRLCANPGTVVRWRFTNP